jgi:hypothetical protein
MYGAGYVDDDAALAAAIATSMSESAGMMPSADPHRRRRVYTISHLRSCDHCCCCSEPREKVEWSIRRRRRARTPVSEFGRFNFNFTWLQEEGM